MVDRLEHIGFFCIPTQFSSALGCFLRRLCNSSILIGLIFRLAHTSRPKKMLSYQCGPSWVRNRIGETRQRSSVNHNRLAVIVYNINYSAISSPMNILFTVGGFYINEVSRARQSGGLESYTLIEKIVHFLCFKNNAAYAGLRDNEKVKFQGRYFKSVVLVSMTILENTSISKNFYQVKVYMCTNFGVFIKKCTIGLLSCCTIQWIFTYLNSCVLMFLKLW